MTVPINVCITTDVSSGSGMHFYAPAPQQTPFAPVPSHEVPTEMDWAPGKKGKHKFAASVRHRNKPIALNGHDCGPLIRDEALYLPSVLNGRIVKMAFASSRRIVFGASTVMMTGSEAGLASAGGGLCSMTSCGEPISLPYVYPQTNDVNTVNVGATQADIDAGELGVWLSIACDVVTFFKDLAESMAFDGLDEGEISELLEKQLVDLWKRQGFTGGLPGKKDLYGMVVGLLQSVQKSRASGWKLPVTVTLGKKKDNSDYSISGKYDPSTGEWSVDGAYSVHRAKGHVIVESKGQGVEARTQYDPADPEPPPGEQEGDAGGVREVKP